MIPLYVIQILYKDKKTWRKGDDFWCILCKAWCIFTNPRSKTGIFLILQTMCVGTKHAPSVIVVCWFLSQQSQCYQTKFDQIVASRIENRLVLKRDDFFKGFCILFLRCWFYSLDRAYLQILKYDVTRLA